MNSIHNNGESEKSLKDGLDKLGRRYHHLDNDVPPDLLDQAILNSAHRAVEKKTRSMKFNALHGLTTAAVFVLVFSLILAQRQMTPVDENGYMNEDQLLQATDKKEKMHVSEYRSDDADLAREEINAYRQVTGRVAPASAAPANATLRAESAAVSADAAVEVDLHEYPKANVSLDTASEAGDRSSIDETDEEIPPGKQQLQKSATEAGQLLNTILRLKQNGDASWRAQLDLFRQTYPDYPVPAELAE